MDGKTSHNNILPTPFLASFRPNPSDQDMSYLRSDGLRQYETLCDICPNNMHLYEKYIIIKVGVIM